MSDGTYLIARRLRVAVLDAPENVIVSDGEVGLGPDDPGMEPQRRGWTTLHLRPHGHEEAFAWVAGVEVGMYNLPPLVKDWLDERVEETFVVEVWSSIPTSRAGQAIVSTVLWKVKVDAPGDPLLAAVAPEVAAHAYTDEHGRYSTIRITTEPVPEPTVPTP